MEQNNIQMNQTIEQGANAYSNTKFLELVAKAEENKAKAAVVVSREQYVPKVNEGQYLAISTDATFEQQLKTKAGLRDCIKIFYSIIVPNEIEPVELTMYYWKTASPTSPYVRQLSTLLGSDSRDGFNISSLIGKYCQVQIKHDKLEDGRIFINVEELSLLNLPTSSTNSIDL